MAWTDPAVREAMHYAGYDPNGGQASYDEWVAAGSPDPAGQLGGGGGGQSVDDVQRQRYAFMDWALNIPGVGDVIRQATREGWDPGGARFQSAIQGTDWWKSTSASARQWQQLQAQDPATANLMRERLSLFAQDAAAQYEAAGFDVTGSVELALKMGYGPSELDAMIRMQSGYYARQQAEERARAANAAYGTISSIARDYALPLSPQAIQQWASQIGSGGSIASFEQYAREQAKSMFPGLADPIDQGITVRQYVEPYVQLYAREVGANPEDVDLTQPEFLQALNVVDPKTGKRVSMSLDQWVSTVRTDPRLGYDRSVNGVAAAHQLTERLAQRLGHVA